MAGNWESTFSNWAKPPGKTEQDKSDNSERAIRTAISSSVALSSRSVSVFPQGSYRNRTTVRQDSDVDICVMCTESIFYDLPDGMSSGDFGITVPAPYPYSQFKRDVHNALVSHFGSSAVLRGNKAFDIHENTYRVDADVVAAFKYHLYRRDGTYLQGTSFPPDSGGRINNWPDQHYDNGVSKNTATGRRFKALTRIAKRLRNEMENSGVSAAINIPSFLIECLVWNVPNEGFGHPTYWDDLRYVLVHLYNSTLKNEDCSNWTEVNGIKYLFHASQPWSRVAANGFIAAALSHVGYS